MSRFEHEADGSLYTLAEYTSPDEATEVKPPHSNVSLVGCSEQDIANRLSGEGPTSRLVNAVYSLNSGEILIGLTSHHGIVQDKVQGPTVRMAIKGSGDTIYVETYEGADHITERVRTNLNQWITDNINPRASIEFKRMGIGSM